MKCAALVAIVGCSGPAKPPVVVAPLPAASTACYAGMVEGMGKRARTIARRTVDPAAGQIVEDVSHDDAAAHGARSFHVVMVVQGDQFTLTETGGAFAGTGNFTGEPWRWTSNSTSRIASAGIEISSDDELTATGMKATKEIRKDGKVLATTTEELATFDCAQWDQAKAELAVPALDAAACERACRNYATLRFWAAADPTIAQLPAAEREAARREKTTEFATKLDAGLASCIEECLAVKNAAQTECITVATTADDATDCAKPH